MIRLLGLLWWHTTRLTFKFLWQFETFQMLFRWYLKVCMWLVIFFLIVMFLWDFLPLVALGFMIYHIYTWRRKEVW